MHMVSPYWTLGYSTQRPACKPHPRGAHSAMCSNCDSVFVISAAPSGRLGRVGLQCSHDATSRPAPRIQLKPQNASPGLFHFGVTAFAVVSEQY